MSAGKFIIIFFLLLAPLFGCGFFTSCFQWEYKPPKFTHFYFTKTLPIFYFANTYSIAEVNAGRMFRFLGGDAKSTANSILVYVSASYYSTAIFFNANHPFGYMNSWGLFDDYNPLVSLGLEGRLHLFDAYSAKALGFIKLLLGYSYGNYKVKKEEYSYHYSRYVREYHPEIQLGIIFENISHNDVRLGLKLNSLDTLFIEFIHRY